MKDDIQKQAGGDKSTNLQGKEITIYQGISYADAKEIALDVYKANFLTLSEKAAMEAARRAEELTDSFLERLKEQMPAAIQTLQEPAMQMALYTAQKEYARTGDKDLESLLVDILVERAQQSERTIRQIVLDESLAVAPKLTIEQLSALTVSFLVTRTRYHSLLSLDALRNYLQSYLIPFVADLTKKNTCYEHLEYAGCGSVMRLGNLPPIESIFNQNYPGLFCKGFEHDQVSVALGDATPPAGSLIQCLHDPKKLQVNAIDTKALGRWCKEHDVSEAVEEKLVSLFNSTRMSDEEVKKYLTETMPALNNLFQVWQKSFLSCFSHTTVGIAVAQANFRRKTGIKLDLSIWVK